MLKSDKNVDNHIQIFISGGISSVIWSEITFYGAAKTKYFAFEALTNKC